MQLTAKQLVDILGGEIQGDENILVSNFNNIEIAKSGDLSFYANPKYEKFVYTTEASIILVSKDFIPSKDVRSTLIRVDDAYSAMSKLLSYIYSIKCPRPQAAISSKSEIHSTAVIGEGTYIAPFVVIEEGVRVGANCIIYPHTYIAKGVEIGDDTIIYSNVSIYYDCKIGNRNIIHSGAVIGADGFGFAPQLDGYHKIPQIGNVIIEDDVEIGANTCIDRAALTSTIIHKGAKLDNLIQIAHNCEVGSHTVMASQTGMAGSSSIGEWCQTGGQTGIAGHLKIGNRVVLGGQTGVLGNIKDDKVLMGSPSMDLDIAKRSYVIFPKLPDMYKKIGALEKELEELKKSIEK